jgi:hypothetical protein
VKTFGLWWREGKEEDELGCSLRKIFSKKIGNRKIERYRDQIRRERVERFRKIQNSFKQHF